MALRMATRLRTVEDIIGWSQNLPSASTKKFVSAALPARARFFPFAKICEIPKSDRPISSRCIPLKAEGRGTGGFSCDPRTVGKEPEYAKWKFASGNATRSRAFFLAVA